MRRKRKLSKYVYYTGMGFQMIATIGLCTFIGYKIDEGRAADKPWFTALFALLGVGMSLYATIRSLTKQEEPPKNK